MTDSVPAKLARLLSDPDVARWLRRQTERMERLQGQTDAARSLADLWANDTASGVKTHCGRKLLDALGPTTIEAAIVTPDDPFRAACTAVLAGWRQHLAAEREDVGEHTEVDKAYNACLEACITELEQALSGANQQPSERENQ